MVLTALRGALGFLSQLPVGHDEAAWLSFRETPVAFPLAGYVVGTVVALPVVLAVAVAPPPTAAFVLPVSVALVAGINHADGVADLGDAAVVHGDAAERRAVMTDTTVGVGAVLALLLVVVGLAFAGLGLAALPLPVVVGLVVAAEVGAKLGMAAVACLGEASHDGMGSAFTSRADPGTLLGPVVVAVPALVLTGPSLVALAAVVGGLAGALVVLWWANRRLGGVSGDVFGAANEVARVVALHAGLLAWVTL